MTQTPLDRALARMQADRDDIAARLGFHAELADTELFLLLVAEPAGEALEPRTFEIGNGERAVLAFDREARLADFAGGVAVPHAAVPGRVLVAMLAEAGQGLSLLVNAGQPEAELMPPEALAWLARTLSGVAPAEAEAVPVGFGAPALTAPVLALLLPALERRLAGVPGLSAAVLAAVEWRGGGRGHVLALAGVERTAQAPLARALAEALELSGLEAGALDVIFPSEAAMGAIAAQGLVLSLPPRARPAPPAGHGPGMDPSRPPKLR